MLRIGLDETWYRIPESRRASGGVRLSTVGMVGSGQLRWIPAGLRVRMRVHRATPSRRWARCLPLATKDPSIVTAQGRSNAGVARELVISERTVEAVCAQIFQKLGLEPSPDENRRVLAVLQLLRG